MADKYTARAQISSDFWTHIYIQRIFYFRDSKASKTKIIQLELFCIPLTPFSMLLLQNIPSILLSKPEILSHLWYLPFLNSPFCLLSSTLQRALSTMYQLIVTITQSVRLISLWTWKRPADLPSITVCQWTTEQEHEQTFYSKFSFFKQ